MTVSSDVDAPAWYIELGITVGVLVVLMISVLIVCYCFCSTEARRSAAITVEEGGGGYQLMGLPADGGVGGLGSHVHSAQSVSDPMDGDAAPGARPREAEGTTEEVTRRKSLMLGQRPPLPPGATGAAMAGGVPLSASNLRSASSATSSDMGISIGGGSVGRRDSNSTITSTALPSAPYSYGGRTTPPVAGGGSNNTTRAPTPPNAFATSPSIADGGFDEL